MQGAKQQKLRNNNAACSSTPAPSTTTIPIKRRSFSRPFLCIASLIILLLLMGLFAQPWIAAVVLGEESLSSRTSALFRSLQYSDSTTTIGIGEEDGDGGGGGIIVVVPQRVALAPRPLKPFFTLTGEYLRYPELASTLTDPNCSACGVPSYFDVPLIFRTVMSKDRIMTYFSLWKGVNVDGDHVSLSTSAWRSSNVGLPWNVSAVARMLGRYRQRLHGTEENGSPTPTIYFAGETRGGMPHALVRKGGRAVASEAALTQDGPLLLHDQYEYGFVMSMERCASNFWHGGIEVTLPIFAQKCVRALSSILGESQLSLRHLSEYNVAAHHDSESSLLSFAAGTPCQRLEEDKSQDPVYRDALRWLRNITFTEALVTRTVDELLRIRREGKDVLFGSAPPKNRWGNGNLGCPIMNHFPYGWNTGTPAGWLVSALFDEIEFDEMLRPRGKNSHKYEANNGELAEDVVSPTGILHTAPKRSDPHNLIFLNEKNSNNKKFPMRVFGKKRYVGIQKGLFYGPVSQCFYGQTRYPPLPNFPFYVVDNPLCSWVLDVIKQYSLAVIGESPKAAKTFLQRREPIPIPTGGSGGAVGVTTGGSNDLPSAAVAAAADEAAAAAVAEMPTQRDEGAESLATGRGGEKPNQSSSSSANSMSNSFTANSQSKIEAPPVSFESLSCPRIGIVQRKVVHNGRAIRNLESVVNALRGHLAAGGSLLHPEPSNSSSSSRSPSYSPLPATVLARLNRSTLFHPGCAVITELDLEDHVSFGEQVRMVHELDILIGVRGMGLTNSMFQKKLAGLLVLSGREAGSALNLDNDNFPWYPLTAVRPWNPTVLSSCNVLFPTTSARTYLRKNNLVEPLANQTDKQIVSYLRKCHTRSVNFCDIFCSIPKLIRDFEVLVEMMFVRIDEVERRRSKEDPRMYADPANLEKFYLVTDSWAAEK